MDPALEEHYLQMAQNNPNMLCSEVPVEILEACSAEAEPTRFLEEFFATGYTHWLIQKYGRRLPQEYINNGILILWLRACRLHTSLITGVTDPDWETPFFANEGL